MGGKTSNISKMKYNAKAYDRIYVIVKKGQKEHIQAVARSNNESVNQFVVTAIDERIKRLRAPDGQ